MEELELKLEDEQESPQAVFNCLDFLAFVMIFPQTGSPTLTSTYLVFTYADVVGRLAIEICAMSGAAVVDSVSGVCSRFHPTELHELIRGAVFEVLRINPLFSG